MFMLSGGLMTIKLNIALLVKALWRCPIQIWQPGLPFYPCPNFYHISSIFTMISIRIPSQNHVWPQPLSKYYRRLCLWAPWAQVWVGYIFCCDLFNLTCVHQTSHTQHLRGFVFEPFVTRGREGTFSIAMYRTLPVHICQPNITASKKRGFVCGPIGFIRGGKGTFSVVLRGRDLWVWVFGGHPKRARWRKIVHVRWSFAIFARARW